MLGLLRAAYHAATKTLHDATISPRSPEWHKVEHRHLTEEPKCAACGSAVKLNVHHVKPFHLHPELELDDDNLITLCMDPANECHLHIGHGGSWKAYNPDVRADAKRALAGEPRGGLVTEIAAKRQLQ